MESRRATFPFDLVMTVGDNIYGAMPPDFVNRFELPYAALLADGVKFQATLGNHDAPETVSYKPFNMSDQRYYTFARNNVRVLVLDSTQMDAGQRAWIERTLSDAREDWKICFLHHPLYLVGDPQRSRARSARGPGADLRETRRQRRVFGPRPRV